MRLRALGLAIALLTATLSCANASGLLPEIETFLEAHPEFGDAVSTQEVPDWARGKRQRVRFDSGRSLLFYTKDGEVITVYEDQGDKGRVKVWGEYEIPPDPTPFERSAEGEIPAYTVLFVNEHISGEGKFGDVLVPSLSRQTPSGEREAIARRIAEKEGINDLSIYSTRDAYEANVSASYADAHPNALSEGFLGSLKNGEWTPGEDIFP